MAAASHTNERVRLKQSEVDQAKVTLAKYERLYEDFTQQMKDAVSQGRPDAKELQEKVRRELIKVAKCRQRIQDGQRDLAAIRAEIGPPPDQNPPSSGRQHDIECSGEGDHHDPTEPIASPRVDENQRERKPHTQDIAQQLHDQGNPDQVSPTLHQRGAAEGHSEEGHHRRDSHHLDRRPPHPSSAPQSQVIQELELHFQGRATYGHGRGLSRLFVLDKILKEEGKKIERFASRMHMDHVTTDGEGATRSRVKQVSKIILKGW